MLFDLKKIERDWAQRGFSFDVWTDPPGKVWEGYVHDVDELFMVIEGDVEMEMEGEKRHLKRGEEILIPRNMVHSIRNKGTTHSRWLYGYEYKRSA